MSTTNFKLVAFRRWAREAPYESVFVYHRTPHEREEALFEHARKLSDAGLAFLFQKRLPSGEWEYCARRTHHEAHIALDKLSRKLNVPSTAEFRAEEGLRGTGRPRKRMEIAA